MKNCFYSVIIFLLGVAISVGANAAEQRSGAPRNATENGDPSGKFIYTTCGQSSNRNCSYWQNPRGISTTYNQINQCTFSVKKCSSDICQVRLDFYSFTLNQPDLDGVCSVDMFTVTSGVSNSVPIICGDNAGQHMYLDVSSNSGNILLSIATSTTNMSRSWNIKATQISCSDYQNIAPNNCLQYFRESSGTIQSFNYKSVALPTAPASITRQLANQDYAICIRTNAFSCGICYTVCPDKLNTYSAAFSVSSAQKSSSPNQLGLDFVCTPDWLQIPCATTQRKATVSKISAILATCASKICGGIFSAEITSTPVPVYSYRRPFQLYYYTDSVEATSPLQDSNNLGFCLNYNQLPCTTTQT